MSVTLYLLIMILSMRPDNSPLCCLQADRTGNCACPMNTIEMPPLEKSPPLQRTQVFPDLGDEHVLLWEHFRHHIGHGQQSRAFSSNSAIFCSRSLDRHLFCFATRPVLCCHCLFFLSQLKKCHFSSPICPVWRVMTAGSSAPVHGATLVSDRARAMNDVLFLGMSLSLKRRSGDCIW